MAVNDALRTPRALVDLDRLERNAARMIAHARALGVRLRPHVKTHKSVDAARIQCGGAPGPVTVSTVAEARAFAAADFRDLTYAVPVAPVLLPELIALTHAVDRLAVLVDHEQSVAAVEETCRAAHVRLAVFLEIDVGHHRTGIDPARDESLRLGARLASSHYLEFRGILTHAGQAYAARTAEEARAVAVQERDAMVGCAARLRAAGVPVPEVSVGSTPTAVQARNLDGVTELRPGNYLFFDAFQAAIGSCTLEDCAFTVRASVVGVYPSSSGGADARAVINAGALALSKDPGPRHVDPDCGFGVVLSSDGEVLQGLRVTRLTQEHGEISGPLPAGLRIGSNVRIIPNHSCLAAAMFDRYDVVRGGEQVAEWRVARGW